MIKEIAICGLRYGKTKYQVEQTKKYIEENNLKKVNITILDSESKKKLDKVRKYIEELKKEKWQNDRTDYMLGMSYVGTKVLQILNEESK